MLFSTKQSDLQLNVCDNRFGILKDNKSTIMFWTKFRDAQNTIHIFPFFYVILFFLSNWPTAEKCKHFRKQSFILRNSFSTLRLYSTFG